MKGLAEELGKLGVENVIAAPAVGIQDSAFRIQGEGGLTVWRFKCSETPGDLGEIYGDGDPVAAESFKKVLDAERPDIVHFHAWSPAVSILLVWEVKRRGIRMVQTYHTPTLSCPRGTLMRWGKVVCDGDLAKRPCVLCAIHGKLRKGDRRSEMGYGECGQGKSRNSLLNPGCGIQGEALYRTSPNPESRTPNPKRSKLLILASKLKTMLRMPGLIRNRTKAVKEMLQSVDVIVALNDWSKKLLVLNGVEAGKIRLIRHGVPAPSAGGGGDRGEGIEEASISSRKGAKDAKGVGEGETKALRLVFLGRVAPEKGIGVLLEALRLVSTKVELDIYGIRTDGGSEKDMGYGISDIGKAKVRWLPPVKPDQVVETIRKYDVLVVPSVCLETGPLVVLEAFAAGVPVMGSRLGGIVEMLRDGVDGLLFDPSSSSDLAEKLSQLPEQLKLLKKGVRYPRDNQEVAQEHLKIYQSLL